MTTIKEKEAILNGIERPLHTLWRPLHTLCKP